jgi:hypothetical protein
VKWPSGVRSQGIAAGALFFPPARLQPLEWLPFAGDLLVSFAAPIVVSMLVSLGWIQLKANQGKTEVFDFGILRRDIQSYGEGEGLPVEGLPDR